jgi:hypothetical protein
MPTVETVAGRGRRDAGKDAMSSFVVDRSAKSFVLCGVAAIACCGAGVAQAQFVTYGVMRPVIAAPVVAAPVVAAPAYVANYFPAGNYAAVTAFSPPVVAAPVEVAVRTAYAPVFAPPVAVASTAVTSVSYYAPAAMAPVVAAPVTTYYAPAAVAMPLYRRGVFGGLRPVRNAYLISY